MRELASERFAPMKRSAVQACLQQRSIGTARVSLGVSRAWVRDKIVLFMKLPQMG